MGDDRMADRGYIWIIVILFSVGWMMVFLNRTALYPLLPILQEEFSLSATEVGVLPSAYYFFYVLLQVPIGLAGDKIGLKRMLTLTYAGSALGVLMVGSLGHNYAILLASMALYGGGAGGFHPMAFSITIKSVTVRYRGMALALINSGSALGLILGLSAAGPAYLATGSWRLLFLVLALPTLLLAILFAWKVRSVPATDSVMGNPVKLLRDRNLLFIYLASFCSLYAFATAVVWGPTFFLTERGLDLSVAGLFTAVIAISGIPAGIGLARLSDRFGRKVVAIPIMPVAALAIFLIAYVQSMPLLVLLLILYGASGKLAWEPIAVAWLGDHASIAHADSMGTALALFGTIGMTSSIVAPVIGGWIQDTTNSLQGAFVLAALFLLLGSILSLIPAKRPTPSRLESAVLGSEPLP